MFKQLFRLTFVTFIWKQYKRLIVSTLLLFSYLWFVGFAHGEYLNFASRQAEQNAIGLSFFIKWGAMIFGVVSYFAYYFFASRLRSTKSIAKSDNKQNQDFSADQDDPFDHIRNKEKLRSRAEIVMDKKK